MTPPHVVVAGGGIAGLAAAERLSRSGQVRVTLVESAARFGGLIATEHIDGFVVEHGPDVILASKAAAIELARRVGIVHRLVGTSAAIRGSLVMSRGRLLPLPEGMTGLVPSRLRPLLTTRLLSPSAKARAAFEWFVPRRAPDEYESVEAFVVRRLGRETYDRIVEPLLAGVFAGDGARLSLDATFPRLRALEQQHRGLLRGFVAERRLGTPNATPGAAPDAMLPRTPFVSFREGLSELTEAVAAQLGGVPGITLRRGASVTAVEHNTPESLPAPSYTLRLADGTALGADAVVLAVPAAVAGALLAPIDRELAGLLASIEHVSTAVVSLGWTTTSVARLLDASGYTVPRIEHRDVLACTWSSAKFEGRAPAGHVLLRVFLGGAGRETVLDRDDAGLVAVARAELERTVGARGRPVLARVTRWHQALPQYTLGHLQRVARIEARLDRLPGVAVAGNALRGVGIPDCVRSGETAAERVLQALPPGGGVTRDTSPR